MDKPNFSLCDVRAEDVGDDDADHRFIPIDDDTVA